MTAKREFTRSQMKMLMDSSITLKQASQMLKIPPSTVEKHRKRNGYRSDRYISEELLSSVEELRMTCSIKQCSEFLNITIAQVQNAIKKLKTRPQGYKTRRIDPPFVMPNGSILIAKTCIGCGNLLAAKWFMQVKTGPSKGRYLVTCKRCTKLHYSTPEGKQSSKDNHDEKQYISRQMAIKWHSPWEQPEEEVLKDKSKTAFQKAIELGRTYYAVTSHLAKMGLTESKSLGDPTKEAWVIYWLKEHEEQRELFKRLGPVDESEWDWNDVA